MNRSQCFSNPAPDEYDLTIRIPEACVAEPYTPGSQDSIVCDSQPLTHRFPKVVIPWLDKTGRPQYGYPSNHTNPGVQCFLCDTGTLRNTQPDLHAMKSLLVYCFFYRVENTGERCGTDCRISFPEPWSIARKPANTFSW